MPLQRRQCLYFRLVAAERPIVEGAFTKKLFVLPVLLVVLHVLYHLLLLGFVGQGCFALVPLQRVSSHGPLALNAGGVLF